MPALGSHSLLLQTRCSSSVVKFLLVTPAVRDTELTVAAFAVVDGASLTGSPVEAALTGA